MEDTTMLFRKKMEHDCSYCQFGARLEDNVILCAKRGLRAANKPCWRFKYDPCKRIPYKTKAIDFAKYDAEDFSL